MLIDIFHDIRNEIITTTAAAGFRTFGNTGKLQEKKLYRRFFCVVRILILLFHFFIHDLKKLIEQNVSVHRHMDDGF